MKESRAWGTALGRSVFTMTTRTYPMHSTVQHSLDPHQNGLSRCYRHYCSNTFIKSVGPTSPLLISQLSPFLHFGRVLDAFGWSCRRSALARRGWGRWITSLRHVFVLVAPDFGAGSSFSLMIPLWHLMDVHIVMSYIITYLHDHRYLSPNWPNLHLTAFAPNST